MEGAPNFTPESKLEKDSFEDKSKKKSGKKSREIGSIIAGAEKAAVQVEKKEKVAIESASLLDKIFNPEKSNLKPKPSETDREEKPERGEEPPMEQDLSLREERVAEALAGEGEIDLRGIAPERDEKIVEQAVDMALEKQLAEAEPAVTNETEAETPQEEPQVVGGELVAETNPEQTEMNEIEEDDDSAAASSSSTPSSRPSAARSSTSTHSSAAPAAAASGGAGAGSGGTRPPTPPTPPSSPGSSSGVPYPRRTFAPGTVYTAPSTATTYTAPTSANTAATPAAIAGAVEDAEYYAYKRGRNKGLVTGLIVGGGIEHIRHKRREKKMERKFSAERKEQTKKIENMRWDRIRETEAAKVREAAAAKYRNAERSSTSVRPEVAAERYAQSPAEVIRQRAEIKSEIEKKLLAERKESERVLSKAEQIELERQREQLELAQGHHIERSAWHNIEVDAHGKAVQETSFEYGHEYYRERAQETGPKSKQLIDGAAGEVALVAAALHSGASSGGQNATAHPNTTVSGSSQQTAAKPSNATPKSVLRTITQPPTTPAGTVGWFVALVVLLVILAIVLL